MEDAPGFYRILSSGLAPTTLATAPCAQWGSYTDLFWGIFQASAGPWIQNAGFLLNLRIGALHRQNRLREIAPGFCERGITTVISVKNGTGLGELVIKARGMIK